MQTSANIPEETLSIMRESGIPAYYHFRQLSEVAKGAQLLEWVSGAGRSDARQGRGWTLVGAGESAYAHAYLLSRALILAGITCRVVSAFALVRLLESDHPKLTRLREATAITVVGLYDPTVEGAPPPWDGYRLRDIQDFLSGRWTDGKAVNLQLDRPWNDGKCTWWSRRFRDLAAEFNSELTVS